MKGLLMAVTAILLLCPVILRAQDKVSVAGIVQNEEGEPLDGVSVVALNTRSKKSTGAVSDNKGLFSFSGLADGPYNFTFSYVGFAQQVLKGYTVKQGERISLMVKLKAQESSLNQVVVVGYGTQKRASITGAVVSVSLDDVKSRSLSDVSEALQGKAPGVIVANEGGDPTSLPRVYIRGLGGVNGEQPLYVVDGSIYTGGPINPNDVESISVLKDAAASIYGAQASGGVILITTKKGAPAGFKITLDAKYGSQSPWRKLHSLNAKEFADVENLAADNAGIARNPAFDASVYPDGQITRTDWVNDIFRNAPLTDYNVGIEGGNGKNKYFMGFGYRNQQGILLNTYTERYNFRINTESEIKPWLKLGENLQYTYTNGNGANTQDAYTGALLSAIFYPSNVAPYNADGSFAGLPAQWAGAYGDVINPVAYLKRIDYKDPKNVLVFNPYAEINLGHGLLYRSNFSITKTFEDTRQFHARVLEIGKIFSNDELDEWTSNTTDLLAEQTLSYTHRFGNHDITALGGYSYKSNKYNQLYAYAQNFDDENPIYRYFQNANDIFKPINQVTSNALVSWFSRLNYGYRSKYLLTLIGRRDGTSKVAAGNRFENYGSVLGAWVISKESFFNNIAVINNLKLRGSYGIMGNLASLPNNALNIPLTPVNVYMGQTPTLVSGYAESALSNPNLHWANSKQVDGGIDIDVLKSRVSLQVDYFVKTTTRMLIQTTPPSTAGVSEGKWENVGEAQDKGFELGLHYKSSDKAAFQYNIGASITRVNNKLVSLDGLPTLPSGGYNVRGVLNPIRIAVGNPVYSYYVIKTAGIFKTTDEINSYKNKSGALIQPYAKPGDIRFVDQNGDGKIDNNDRVTAGSPFPDFSYGLSFNASYKNFDLNIFAQGVQGIKVFNSLKYLTMNAAIGTNYNMLKDVLGAWSPTNPNSSIPRISASDLNGSFGNTSDFYLEDGSYLRIKSVTLGYTLPAGLTSRVKLNAVRLYVTSNNLFTFTRYKGFDPEVGMDNYGIDYGRYPQARTLMAGLNINF